MKAQRDTASFVLRFTHDLWQDQQGEPRVEWRGQVRRVQDGAELRFTDLTEAMDFIRESLMKVTMQCVPKDDEVFQEKAMQESLKLWEKFAQGYTDMMVEALQRTVKQSELIQKQMGQVMKPWWLTAPANPSAAPADPIEQTQVLQAVTALQAQVEALAAKVAELEATVKTQA
jgi:hypothetical protein